MAETFYRVRHKAAWFPDGPQNFSEVNYVGPSGNPCCARLGGHHTAASASHELNRIRALAAHAERIDQQTYNKE